MSIHSLKSSSSALTLNSLLSYSARSLVRFYQVSFAFFLGGNCRYYPSCSHYAVESFEKHSFLKAAQLTLFRLASCHPFSRKPSYDPVPMTNQERSLYE